METKPKTVTDCDHDKDIDTKVKEAVVAQLRQYGIQPQNSSSQGQSLPQCSSGTSTTGNRSRKSGPPVCYTCGWQGHVQAYCPLRGQPPAQPAGSAPTQVQHAPPPAPTTNYPYRAPTPVSATTNQHTTTAPIQATTPASSSQPYTARQTESVEINDNANLSNDEAEMTERIAIHVLLHINNQKVLACLDTGAEINIIPASLVENLSLKPTQIEVKAANTTEIAVDGRISIECHIDDQPVTLLAVVSKQVNEILLGQSFLKRNRIVPDIAAGTATINGVTTKLLLRPVRGWTKRVIVVNHITIPPRSEAVIPTSIQFNGRINTNFDHETLMNDNSLPLEGLCVARSILPPRTTGIPIRLVNSSNKPIHLKPGFPLAKVEKVEIIQDNVMAATGHRSGPVSVNSLHYTNDASGQLLQQQQQQHVSGDGHLLQQQQQQLNADISGIPSPAHVQDVDEIIDHLIESVDPSVSDDHKVKLRALCQKYRSVFSTGDFDVGLIPSVEHAIDTGNAPPFRERLRRHPPQHEAII